MSLTPGQVGSGSQSFFGENAANLGKAGIEGVAGNQNANVINLLRQFQGVTPEAFKLANESTDFTDVGGFGQGLADKFGFAGDGSPRQISDFMAGSRRKSAELAGFSGDALEAALGNTGGGAGALPAARDRLRASIGGQPVQADLGGPGTQQQPRFGPNDIPSTIAPGAQQEGLNMPPGMARAAAPQPDAPTFGTDITDFGPDATLRGNQIAPGGNAGGNFSGLPDRQALASDTFRLLREQSEPAFQKALQGVGRRAAALGRIGSGMTTSELGDVTSVRERNLAQAARGLSLDTAGQAFNDRLNENQFNFGVGRSNRGELRTERDFQTGQARTAVEDRIRQRLIEDQLQNTASRRELDRLRLSGQLGFQPGASRTDLLGSDILAGQSAGQSQSVIDLLRARARGGAAA